MVQGFARVERAVLIDARPEAPVGNVVEKLQNEVLVPLSFRSPDPHPPFVRHHVGMRELLEFSSLAAETERFIGGKQVLYRKHLPVAFPLGAENLGQVALPKVLPENVALLPVFNAYGFDLPEVLEHFGKARVALLAILGHAACHERCRPRVEHAEVPGRDVGPLKPAFVPAIDIPHRPGVRHRRVWQGTGQCFMETDTQAENVGALVAAKAVAPFQIIGGHVVEGPLESRRGRHGGVLALGNAKVDHLGRAVTHEEDVGRLDIAMRHAHTAGVGEGLHALGEDPLELRPGHARGVLGHELLEFLALEELHYEAAQLVAHFVLDGEPVQVTYDVRVVEGHERVYLALETAFALAALLGAAQDLQGHVLPLAHALLAVRQAARMVHAGLPPRADTQDQLVVPHPLVQFLTHPVSRTPRRGDVTPR